MASLTKKQQDQIFLMHIVDLIRPFNPEKNGLNEILPMLCRMEKLERQLQRLAELSCNGYPKPVVEQREGKWFRYDVEDEGLRARCEKKEERLEKQVSELAKEFNMTVEFQGDPRGRMFVLKTPQGREISI